MTYTFIRYKNYEEYLASNLGLDSHSRLLANGEVIELPPEDENNVRMASELDYLLKQVVKPSAASTLNFRVNGNQFASGIFNFHLPIDAPLGVVDVS